MKRRSFLHIIGSAVGAATLLSGCSLIVDQRASVSKRPNILIILADDMGYSDPGYMGGDADTPNLDALAKDGMFSANCYNNAKCAPTRASLMTGLYNQRTDTHRSAGNIAEHDAVCIAQLFRDAGYAAILSGKWHINPKPLEVGFERHFGSLLTPVYFNPVYSEKASLDLDGEPHNVPEDKPWYSTIAYTDFAIDTIKEEALEKKRPFFLYLAYHAPHWPLHALPEDIEKYKDTFNAGTDVMRKERYERMIEIGIVDPKIWKLPELEEGVPHWDELSPKDQERMSMKLAIHTAMVDRMDKEIGRLVEFLKETGQFENTLIFFLSDNGACKEGGMLGDQFEEKFDKKGELGTVHSFPALGSLGAAAVNTPLRKYKSTLYEGGCCTSLVMNWPGNIKNTKGISREICHVNDIVPTCLEAAGVDYPEKYNGKDIHPLDGRSLVPVLKGGAIEDRVLCWNFKQERVARNSRWKLIGQAEVGDRKGKPWELYDLANDRSETENVADRHPEIVKELSGKWDAWNKDTRALEGYEAWVNRKKDKKNGSS